MKYKALMDGLECCEILYSQLNDQFRIDAEYFRKENLRIEKIISEMEHKAIDEFARVTDGIHTSIAYDEDSPVNLISATSPKKNIFDLSRNAHISETEHLNNPRTALIKNDVILSSVGTIGNCAVVDESILPANSDRHVAIIRINDDMQPHYLSSYLLSKYGNNQVLREITGNVQPNIFLYKIRKILIPLISYSFRQTIEHLNLTALQTLEESKACYQQARQLLITELSFDPAAISTSRTTTKTLSESFGVSGRLDAEYYQPKYDDIEKLLIQYDPNVKKLSDIVKYLFTGEYTEVYYNSTDKNGLQHYIRGTDIKNGLIEKDDSHCIDPDHFTKFVSAGDIVTGRVGTIGNFGVVSKELDGALCSDNILCFRLPDEYLPDVYALFFNDSFIGSLILRMARGSVQQRLNQETLKEVPVPFIKKDAQIRIQATLQESFALRRKAEQLIDVAVKAVEIAIEINEQAAIDYINEQTK